MSEYSRSDLPIFDSLLLNDFFDKLDRQRAVHDTAFTERDFAAIELGRQVYPVDVPQLEPLRYKVMKYGVAAAAGASLLRRLSHSGANHG